MGVAANVLGCGERVAGVLMERLEQGVRNRTGIDSDHLIPHQSESFQLLTKLNLLLLVSTILTCGRVFQGCPVIVTGTSVEATK